MIDNDNKTHEFGKVMFNLGKLNREIDYIKSEDARSVKLDEALKLSQIIHFLSLDTRPMSHTVDCLEKGGILLGKVLDDLLKEEK